jgi:hypothetical protein
MEKLQPHNKQVRSNINNIDLTMAKSNRNSTKVPVKNAAKAKRVHTISGFKPFLYDAEEWDTTSPYQNLKTTENGNKLDNKMYVLQGDETPEQLMLWIKNYDDKINVSLAPAARLTFLRRIVDKEAQTIVSNVEAAFESIYINKIEDQRIRAEIRAECPTDNAISVYFGDNANAARKRLKITHIIQECMYHLKLKIFGNERLGRSSFIQLKRTINNMKISPQLGVAAWSKRFDTFQLYLPMTLWDAGAKRGLYPTKYDEERCRELLEYALSPVYLTELHDDGWCLSSKPYAQSITKLKEIEPGILKQLKFAKEQLQQAKDIAELQKGKSTTASRDRKQKSGGEKQKRECVTCGKNHAGECWKLQNGGGNNGGRKGNNYNTFNKEAKQYMKAMFARQASGDDDSSDSDDDDWKNGMNQAEQMHVLASAGVDPSEKNIQFDPSDLKRYKKQAKKYLKRT